MLTAIAVFIGLMLLIEYLIEKGGGQAVARLFTVLAVAVWVGIIIFGGG